MDFFLPFRLPKPLLLRFDDGELPAGILIGCAGGEVGELPGGHELENVRLPDDVMEGIDAIIFDCGGLNRGKSVS